MSKIPPSAQDFLQLHHQISFFYDYKTDKMVCFSDDVEKAMIEFAKMHLDLQQKEIIENVTVGFLDNLGGEGTKEIGINKDSILNAYPLENIK